MLKKIKRRIRRIKNKIVKRKVDKEINNFKKLTLKKISKVTGLEIPKELRKLSDQKIDDVVLSVRLLSPNCIYFALNTYEINPKNFDKIRENALFVVTNKKIEGCNCIVCENPGFYGKKYFNYIRNLVNPKVVAVTGSVGKTSTKDMIAKVLKEKYQGEMIASYGNTNSTIRMVTYIKKFTSNIKVYLQEVAAGSNIRGLVKNTTEIIEPDIAVYTNIKDSHMEYYGSRENIAKEKSNLAKYSRKKALVVINYDDEILRNMDFNRLTYSYSLNNSKADFYAKNINITTEGTFFTIIDNIRKKKLEVSLNVIGEHHILNALVAYIVGKELKIKNDLIKNGLLNYKTSGIRQNLVNVGSYKVFADCYNSSYDALYATVKALNIMEPKRQGQKVAVIGDILELADISKDTHIKVGKMLSEYNFKNIIFTGKDSKYSYDEYKKYKDNAFYFTKREEVINKINEIINRDDIILFKGSHGMCLYEIIDECFGTTIGENSDIGSNLYKIEKKDDFEYFVFNNHATISKYTGNSKKLKISDNYNELPIEKLGAEVFKDNTTIKEIVLPKYVSRINDNCFSNSSIEKIEFNENLHGIGKEAFSNCKNIKNIILPERMLFINNRAFANCTNLKKIYIPRLTRIIAKDAFLNCDNVVICCKDKSFAKQYAENNNIDYEIVK